jgi:hypothetical protein
VLAADNGPCCATPQLAPAMYQQLPKNQPHSCHLSGAHIINCSCFHTAAAAATLCLLRAAQDKASCGAAPRQQIECQQPRHRLGSDCGHSVHMRARHAGWHLRAQHNNDVNSSPGCEVWQHAWLSPAHAMLGMCGASDTCCADQVAQQRAKACKRNKQACIC